MKKCVLLAHSNSPSVSKRQDSIFTTKAAIHGEWSEPDKVWNIEDKNTLNTNKKFKMPALLRLNSVGEAGPSCSLLDGSKSRFRSSSMVSDTESPNTRQPVSFVVSSASGSAQFPMMERLKHFAVAPTHQSTPNLKKSTSYPGTSVHEPSRCTEPSCPNKKAKAKLFLNNSVPVPCASLSRIPVGSGKSTPALWKGSQSFDGNLLKQCSMSDYDYESTPPVDIFTSTVCSKVVDYVPLHEFLLQHYQQIAKGIQAKGDETHSECQDHVLGSERVHDKDSEMKADESEKENVAIEADSKPESKENCRHSSFSKQQTDDKQKEEMSCVTPDRTFVLFQRRKCTKKGRPSAKKQKKRKREKLKQSEVTSSREPSLIISFSINEDSENSLAGKPKTDGSNSTKGSVDSALPNSPERPKVLIKDNSHPSPSLACIFISGANIESDSLSSEDTGSDYDESWWSEEGEDEEQVQDVDVNFSFGGLLSLDSIFKKKEVSPAERQSETSGPVRTCFTDSPGNTSNDDSLQFSFSDSETHDLSSPQSLQSKEDSFFSDLNQGLWLNSIVSGVVSLPSLDTSSKNSQQSSTDRLVEEQGARLGEINSRWDRHYPNAGFRSCNGTEPVICNQAVKVCFADDTNLETIHEVGTEDRRGNWHTDGCRFRERIARVGEILAPVLDIKHREKVFKRTSLGSSDSSESS